MKSDELMHYKYLKKEKKNGKWRYYYETKEYTSGEKDDIYGM